MTSYDDIFKKESEISIKELVKAKFGEWWSDDEIQQIILYIVNDQMANSIRGAMKNFDHFYKSTQLIIKEFY